MLKLAHRVLIRQQANMSRMVVVGKEVRLPVPWGYIAGKWWGPSNVRPIVAVHGWQDNSGTFDCLLPLLPQNLSYLAIDLPGHGRSSPLPAGIFYHQSNTAIHIRRLQHLFGWPCVSLMGHSLGAIACFQFSGLFAGCVDLLVCIDGLSGMLNRKGIGCVATSIDDFLKYDSQSPQDAPAYTLEEMIAAMDVAYRQSIDKDKCEYILRRQIDPSPTQPGKFTFRRDRRLKTGPLFNWPMEDIFAHARHVRMPMFLSKTEDSVFFCKDSVYEQVKAIVAANNSRYEFHRVRGKHHGHLNHPHVYEDILSKFLTKYSAGDRYSDERVFDRISLSSQCVS